MWYNLGIGEVNMKNRTLKLRNGISCGGRGGFVIPGLILEIAIPTLIILAVGALKNVLTPTTYDLNIPNSLSLLGIRNIKEIDTRRESTLKSSRKSV